MNLTRSALVITSAFLVMVDSTSARPRRDSGNTLYSVCTIAAEADVRLPKNLSQRDVDDAALIAICAHVCRSPEEGRLKAKYLLQYLEGMADLGRDGLEALLRSIAGGSLDG